MGLPVIQFGNQSFSRLVQSGSLRAFDQCMSGIDTSGREVIRSAITWQCSFQYSLAILICNMHVVLISFFIEPCSLPWDGTIEGLTLKLSVIISALWNVVVKKEMGVPFL